MNCDKCNVEMTMEKFNPETMMFKFVCKKCGNVQNKSKIELESEYSKITQKNNKD